MDKKPHQITPKITAFMTKLTETQNPLKRRLSATSPTGIQVFPKNLMLISQHTHPLLPLCMNQQWKSNLLI